MNVLKKYKKKHGYKYKELEEKIGITKDYLYRICAGKLIPTRQTALKIAEVTGLNPIDLLYLSEFK